MVSRLPWQTCSPLRVTTNCPLWLGLSMPTSGTSLLTWIDRLNLPVVRELPDRAPVARGYT